VPRARGLRPSWFKSADFWQRTYSNPLYEEVSSVGRLLKRFLIEALILAAPFVWRKIRDRRRGKK
jgi:hypothetical protein